MQGAPPSQTSGTVPSKLLPSRFYSSKRTKRYSTVFSNAMNGVPPGPIRVEISDSDQWRAGDVAILQNQEARTVRCIGNLVFGSPLQQRYSEGTEVRTLLPSERLEEGKGSGCH